MIPSHITEYLTLLEKEVPNIGEIGEIRIITNPEEIMAIEESAKKWTPPNITSTSSIPWWRSGIISCDRFFTHLRDPVEFPNKTKGLYDRTIYTSSINSGSSGIAIIPVTKNDEIVLQRTFRHATRSYFLETPGTIAQPGESEMDAVKRCAQDELGVTSLDDVQFLGSTVSERGLIGVSIPIFMVRVSSINDIKMQDPMVLGHFTISLQKYLAIRSTNAKVDINGNLHKTGDAYADAAILLLLANNILKM